MKRNRVLAIRSRLIAAFAPTELEVIDESDKHKGHPGARDGRGHFRVKIISPRFAGKKRIERHRMVFEALDSLLKTEIHALSVHAAATEADKLN
ncbi:MAG: BolA family transcriptional regulator [Rhodothermales bacterium]|nr:BolA family transcriptional regulator [Rhodothermales bacterium]